MMGACAQGANIQRNLYDRDSWRPNGWTPHTKFRILY